MAAPLIPLLARFLPMMGRVGGAAARAGGMRAAGRTGTRAFRRRSMTRSALAALGRREAVRQFVRTMPRGPGSRFAGRIHNVAQGMVTGQFLPSPVTNPAAARQYQQSQNPLQGPMGGATRALAMFSLKMGAATTAIGAFALAQEKVTRQLVESRRELAPYSGRISGAFARLDVQDIQQRRLMAQGTAGSTSMLIDSQRKQEAALRDLRQDLTTLSNTLGTVSATFGRFVGESYTFLKDAIPILSPLMAVLRKLERNPDLDGGDKFRKGFTDALMRDALERGFTDGKQPRDLPPLK